jgi:SagB-type dehydrogenase family enzyme
VTATVAKNRALSPAEVAVTYHLRTKHGLERYAAGPETLDWSAQPNPFREFAGSVRTPLPLTARMIATSFSQTYAPGSVPPAPLTLASLGALMELSMGLSAWKEYGPDRWALRCNPSSGNLHPTEAYVLARQVSGLEDGLYHYLSRDHVLEKRCAPASGGAAPGLWIGLASVHWREAWKYGERAFRYCQLDIGHALATIRYAAGALGWSARMVEGIDGSALAALMGVDRLEDFTGAEPEDADLLIAIETDPLATSARATKPPDEWPRDRIQWTGRANLLDPHPIHRWPIIDDVSRATQGGSSGEDAKRISFPPLQQANPARAADVILGRRSAQRFDAKSSIRAEVFYYLLDHLLDRPAAPWDVWSFTPRVHPVFFVHRVDGLESGLYALPRHPAAGLSLRVALRDDFEWQKPAGTPDHLPFVRLVPANCRAIAKTVSCHQAIAGDGCFAVSMLSEFEATIKQTPWRYRQLHWEAGLLGHVLYLEAEAAGLRGTGIGCYFDDALHSLLGIGTLQYQALYHFTVGHPITDSRIMTLPAYPDRQT